MSAGIFTNGPATSLSVSVYAGRTWASSPRNACHVSASIFPVARSPFDSWNAATARRMFSPKPPSISPGENHARSSRICARTTAPPRAPLARVAVVESSVIAARSSRAAGESAGCLGWAASQGSASARINAARSRMQASVVEFGGPFREAHGRVVAVLAAPAAAFGHAHLADGQPVLVDLQDGRQARAPHLDRMFRRHLFVLFRVGLVETESRLASPRRTCDETPHRL